MALHEEPVDLAQSVVECVSMVEQRAEAKELDLTTDVQEGLPLIRADLTRMRQIILNLVTNAVKFTEQGGRVRSGLLAAQVFRRLVVRGHAGSAVG